MTHETLENQICTLNSTLQESIISLTPTQAMTTLAGENFKLSLAELIRLSKNPMYPTSNNSWAVRAEVKRQLLKIAGYHNGTYTSEAA